MKNVETKSALFSSIFMSSLALIIIGLEPFIPQLSNIVPPEFSALISIILPSVILVARKYHPNDPIHIIPQRNKKYIDYNSKYDYVNDSNYNTDYDDDNAVIDIDDETLTKIYKIINDRHSETSPNQ